MATNGETQWKAYGERCFTAKATVVTGVGSGTNINGNIEVDRVYITDATARTAGSSDVDMQAEYTITYVSGGTSMVQKLVTLYTIIEYVDHDYNAGQIQVKHSWTKS